MQRIASSSGIATSVTRFIPRSANPASDSDKIWITVLDVNEKPELDADDFTGEVKENEKNGIVDFMRILRLMSSMEVIEFGVEDIVRSGLVKEYILAKLELGL